MLCLWLTSIPYSSMLLLGTLVSLKSLYLQPVSYRSLVVFSTVSSWSSMAMVFRMQAGDQGAGFPSPGGIYTQGLVCPCRGAFAVSEEGCTLAGVEGGSSSSNPLGLLMKPFAFDHSSFFLSTPSPLLLLSVSASGCHVQPHSSHLPCHGPFLLANIGGCTSHHLRAPPILMSG